MRPQSELDQQKAPPCFGFYRKSISDAVEGMGCNGRAGISGNDRCYGYFLSSRITAFSVVCGKNTSLRLDYGRAVSDDKTAEGGKRACGGQSGKPSGYRPDDAGF